MLHKSLEVQPAVQSQSASLCYTVPVLRQNSSLIAAAIYPIPGIAHLLPTSVETSASTSDSVQQPNLPLSPPSASQAYRCRGLTINKTSRLLDAGLPAASIHVVFSRRPNDSIGGRRSSTAPSRSTVSQCSKQRPNMLFVPRPFSTYLT